MNQKAEFNTSFIKDFENLSQRIAQSEQPQWLSNLRSANLDRFTKLGIPTTKNEEWKYTNILPITEHTFNVASKGELNEKKEYTRYCEGDGLSLVFINGHFSQELTNLESLPKGLTITTIEEALKNDDKTLENTFKKYASEEACTFEALNSAFSNNGSYIKVDKNAVIEGNIHIVHVTSSSNGETLSLPRTVIHVEKSAEATVLESHVSFSDEITYFANALTDIILEENATLHYCKAQKESLKAFHIGNTRVWQETNSNFDSISLMCGAAITRNNLNIVLNGEGINSTLNGLYSNFDEQHVDNHTSVDHRFPNCTSNQLYKGILNGASRAVFNGKIFVREIAQQTNSYQLNKNLLLGTDCRVDTKPQLEIFADDVKCTHGATVGQLDEDELFYLQTRCITRQEAVKMLARGFVDDLLNTIKNENVNTKLHILLEPSFAKF